jgi:hypothetical protein
MERRMLLGIKERAEQLSALASDDVRLAELSR